MPLKIALKTVFIGSYQFNWAMKYTISDKANIVL